MNWGDERYVRLYTRDTADWVTLGWEAQALFALLLRKVDRAGILWLGKHGLRAVAVLLGMPGDVVDRAIKPLVDDGCIELRGQNLVIRNFIEAQEAKASDVQRQREHREKKRALAMTAVTTCHAPSQDVTPSRAVPFLAVPPVPTSGNQPPADSLGAGGAIRLSQEAFSEIVTNKPRPTKKTPNPRHTPIKLRLLTAFLAIRGVEYGFSSGDGAAISKLLGLCADDDEIENRWRRALGLSAFPGCSSLVTFASRWNDLAGKPKQQMLLRQKRVGAEEVQHSNNVDEDLNFGF